MNKSGATITDYPDAHQTKAMNPLERRASMALASIYALRMLGLFMILPVFVLYSQTLEGATPFLAGMAIGAYGLSQAILQIPFGVLSDRIGRKPIIIVGLVIFALGSVVAALSDSIWGVLAGRILQGAGAIAGAVMALTADLTREEHRTKAMAFIGASIGLSFALALVAGPVLDALMGVRGIFWLTALLALGGILVVAYLVPTPTQSRLRRDAEPVPSQLGNVLKNRELVRLNLGVMVLHMVLTATFVVVPLALKDEASLPTAHHWWVYLPVLLVGMAAMVPFVIIAEKRRRMKQVLGGAIFLLACAELLLLIDHTSVPGIVVGLLAFFIAFNVLEAILPSLIAKIAPPDKKGTAMGIFSTSQFLGAFLGGTAGGAIYSVGGMDGVFIFTASMLVLWLSLAVTMRSPRYLSSMIVNIGPMAPEQAQNMVVALTRVRGVAEAVVIADEGVAYLKVDNNALDRDALEHLRRSGVPPPEQYRSSAAF